MDDPVVVIAVVAVAVAAVVVDMEVVVLNDELADQFHEQLQLQRPPLSYPDFRDQN